MRIAFFTNNYLPNPYGVTVSVENFRKALEAEGHQVYIFASRWNGCRENEPLVFRYPSIDLWYRFRFPLPLPFAVGAEKALRAFNPDIIHAHHPVLLGTAAARFAAELDRPLVFTWHTLYDHYANFVPPLLGPIGIKWMIARAVRYTTKANRVVVPSLSAKRRLVEWGVAKEKLQIIPTGIEPNFLGTVTREEARQSFGFTPNDKVVLTVSRLTEEKNIPFLMRSMLPFLKARPTVKWLLVGGGYLEPALQAEVREAGLSERVIFWGQRERHELPLAYRAGDAFAYASTSETQGLVVAEAMVAGMPVVAVRGPGIEDGIADGVTGALVNQEEAAFRDALEKYLLNDDVRRAAGEAGIRRANEEFSASACAKRLVTLYESAIHEKANPGA